MFPVVPHVADICGIRPGTSKYDLPAEVAPFVLIKLSLALALPAFQVPLCAKVSFAVESLFCKKILPMRSVDQQEIISSQSA